MQLKGEVARYKRKYTEKGQVGTSMITKITDRVYHDTGHLKIWPSPRPFIKSDT